MPRAAVKGGEVGAVDTNWKGTSGLEFLFLTRLNGGWLEAAEIIVCSMLVAHNETGAVSGSDGLAGKVLDLKGGSDWLTGTWRGIRESDTLVSVGLGRMVNCARLPALAGVGTGYCASVQVIPLSRVPLMRALYRPLSRGINSWS